MLENIVFIEFWLSAIEVQLALKQMGLSQYSIYACFSQGI